MNFSSFSFTASESQTYDAYFNMFPFSELAMFLIVFYFNSGIEFLSDNLI